MTGVDEGATSSGDLWQAFLSSHPGLVRVLTPDGRLESMNRSGPDAASIEEVSSRQADWASLWPAPIAVEIRAALAGALAGEERQFDAAMPGDDTQSWRFKISVLSNGDRRPWRLLCSVRPVTDDAASQALFESAFHHAAVGKAFVSLDGGFMRLNRAFASLVGYDEAELLQKTFQDITHPGDLDIDLSLLGQLVAGEITDYSLDKRYIRAGGSVVWVHLTVCLVRDAEGAPHHFISQVHDISGRKAAEQALEAAIVEANAATEIKSQFLANMSHEIRTPLTAIVGFTDLLAVRDDLAGEALTHVNRIQSGAQSLLALVNDILDFSKLDAGQLEIRAEPAEPARLLRETLELFTLQAQAKGLTLDLTVDDGVPAWVSVDAHRMRQILINLVGNAIKFTERGGVQLRASLPGDGRLAFSIQDTGCGLSASAQRKLFQRFSQIDGSTTRRHGGTGLGLAICRGLVEAMGGAISVVSTPGEGSSFSFEVKAPSIAAPGATKVDDSQSALGAVRALVVDDNAVNRELVRLILTSIGVEVSEAADGETGVGLAGLGAYDVILMDQLMPGMDGRAATRQIRQGSGLNAETPILAFTADVQFARYDDEEALYDGVLGKPLVAQTLIKAVMAAVEGGRTRPARRLGQIAKR
jgi:PAS domain S-box-containing protein